MRRLSMGSLAMISRRLLSTRVLQFVLASSRVFESRLSQDVFDAAALSSALLRILKAFFRASSSISLSSASVD
jgi:hypothetical protein